MLIRRNHVHGFTLVELMVVVAVLAFLLMMSGPSFAEWIRGSRVRGAAESIHQGLLRARADAVTRNQNVSFRLMTSPTGRLDSSCATASTSASWMVSVDDPTGKCDATTPSVAPRIIAAADAGDGAAQVSVSAKSSSAAAADTVTFDPAGRVVGSTTGAIATIAISAAGGGARRYEVRISPVGSVRLCEPDLAASDVRACS
ncbi:GspH/FimT family pseudopilin [Ramlibacter humi]|uniref:Type II secretion system protein H n=1 Tax=Ramlibacter humi TaxID=2530451 RepID=A0A4Z0BCQ0_9BURK|nr:GspH/FimT family pseudopilin [Ramlibacter humi]TFY97035.1 prepilin-type N-terminal cleavage/methylation domain-containing protein [Ramlibacter humi]